MTVEQPVVRGHEIAVALHFWYASPEAGPLRREEPADLVGEPVHVGAPGVGDREQDHRGHPLRVPLGVGQGERDAPRSAPHEPAPDAEVCPERLDVADEMVCRVRREVRRPVAGMRQASSTAALVELDDAIARRVEPATSSRRAPAARAAVERHRRRAVRVAGGLPVDRLAIADVEHARRVRLDRRVGRRPVDRSRLKRLWLRLHVHSPGTSNSGVEASTIPETIVVGRVWARSRASRSAIAAATSSLAPS